MAFVRALVIAAFAAVAVIGGWGILQNTGGNPEPAASASAWPTSGTAVAAACFAEADPAGCIVDAAAAAPSAQEAIDLVVAATRHAPGVSCRDVLAAVGTARAADDRASAYAADGGACESGYYLGVATHVASESGLAAASAACADLPAAPAAHCLNGVGQAAWAATGSLALASGECGQSGSARTGCLQGAASAMFDAVDRAAAQRTCSDLPAGDARSACWWTAGERAAQSGEAAGTCRPLTGPDSLACRRGAAAGTSQAVASGVTALEDAIASVDSSCAGDEPCRRAFVTALAESGEPDAVVSQVCVTLAVSGPPCRGQTAS